jgi:DNA/RNA-binding domain of Phe-tRNA-synthetase-like protein
MLEITETSEWRNVHAGATIGLLELRGVDNQHVSPALEAKKREAEDHLRSTYTGYGRKDFLAIPVLAAYKSYYRGFKKTYHVQLQLESLVNGDRDLPAVSPLVDANFLAEMTTFVLTAGHDAGRLVGPIAIDASRAGDEMTLMGGKKKAIYPGDMVMRDADGICCSIIYGQDNRSPISRATDHVLYVSYAPPGVSADETRAQLATIEDNVRLFSPRAEQVQRRLITAA